MQSSALMRWPRLSYGALPLVILLLVLIACVIGYGLANANLEVSRGKSVERTLKENEIRNVATLDSYVNLTRGSNGFVQAAPVNEADWRQYMDVFNLKENFSGLEAIGVAYTNDSSSVVPQYVTPFTPETQRGLDVNFARNDSLRETIRQATARGETVVSEPFPNIISTKNDISTTNTGFLMFTPFYDLTKSTSSAEERERAIAGYTIALFRGDIYFEHVFRNVEFTNRSVKVYLGDDSPDNLLYEGGETVTSNTRTVIQTINLHGKTFTFVYTFDVEYILSFWLTCLPQILVVSGLFVGMLIAGVSGYLMRNRYQRLTFEKEREVNFAKDELLSLASHQLRTPATGVKQYLGMVLQGFTGEVTDQQRVYLERAYNSNNRQLSVINDILHLAKLEAGRIVLSEHKFDIANMMRDVIDEQKDVAEKGEVELELSAPPRGMMIGDSHMLQMVVENLVSNAIKYTAPGGTVSVRLVQRGSRWVISVKDSGVGIAKADYSKLFKQFSRISNPRSDFVTGTGVGLYLAYHLTILHGGTISVVSVEGKGSTFTVRLPRKM